MWTQILKISLPLLCAFSKSLWKVAPSQLLVMGVTCRPRLSLGPNAFVSSFKLETKTVTWVSHCKDEWQSSKKQEVPRKWLVITIKKHIYEKRESAQGNERQMGLFTWGSRGGKSCELLLSFSDSPASISRRSGEWSQCVRADGIWGSCFL